jgi:hypothetical protein
MISNEAKNVCQNISKKTLKSLQNVLFYSISIIGYIHKKQTKNALYNVPAESWQVLVDNNDHATCFNLKQRVFESFTKW